MKSKVASTVLSGLLYTQGLLGFAGVTTIVLTDRMQPEPVVVGGAANVIPASRRWTTPVSQACAEVGGSNR